MSNLLSSLTLAARSLDAQTRGLSVTGQNIANVNTPGYSRRVIDFAAVAPTDKSSAGNGVDAVAIRATRDRLIEARIQQEVPSQKRQAAVAEVLSTVETSLGKPGASLDADLTKFFDAFSRLSEQPQSAVARNEVMLEGQSLATSFRTMASRLTASMQDTDTKVRSAVGDINTLGGQIANINAAMGAARQSGSAETLVDQQNQLVRQLSELTDVEVLQRPEGGVDVNFGNGRPLVVGANTYAVGIANTPPSGYASLTSNGSTVTSEITGGRLGGLLEARDVLLPSYMTQLDTLANTTAAQVNSLHAAGRDQGGNPGGNFFAPLGAVAGSAALIAIDPAIAGSAGPPAVAPDPSKIVAASTPAAGDNDTARLIANLRDQRVLNGNTATLTDGWSQLVYGVGRDSQAAQQQEQVAGDIVNQVDQLREQASGVSLDEEAMQMLKFQRAYEANARFFSTINQTLDILMQTVAS